MPRTQTRLVDIEGELIPPYDTEKGWHFYDGSVKVWLPKSQVEWHPKTQKAGDYEGTMVIPRWLAVDKGLV